MYFVAAIIVIPIATAVWCKLLCARWFAQAKAPTAKTENEECEDTESMRLQIAEKT